MFHFICEKYGLDDIRMRQLKISRIQDLSDPFELLSVELSNEQLRNAFHATKDEFPRSRGMLCFSKRWCNPAQWSHYADKHRELVLGFDVPDDCLLTVSYSAKRLLAEAEQVLATGRSDERGMLVGSRSNLSRSEIDDALGDLAKDVDVFKARLAFRSFRVVRNKDQSLWT